ncbi:DUF2968 domain-containing protein [Caballeronia sp. SL2Y3]|uniref:DUF2968 domain-containing protein n=1 Tax=Caballeronia sp. SL2Y3 TaxID=2878151 RepID=UPI001FD1C739|nr:DUF2968 domain-containing protein [Caballeronia sp. SL2Y3]
MKSLLSRRGTLLDNAPSFLLRQKGSAPVRFAAQSKPDAPEPSDESEPAAPQTATRVTPLRPTGGSAPFAAHGLQAAQIAEVEWLIQQSTLAVFRTFQSFAYSASLLFYPRDLTYYAVLYHEDAVWRVLKAGDIDAAEPAFRHFVEQAVRLAEAEMRRAHLQAQNEQFARLIAESEAQVERSRVDLQRGSTQDQEVALRQQEVRKDLAQLEVRRVAAQAQLNKLQRQMHQLAATSNETVPHLPSGR